MRSKEKEFEQQSRINCIGLRRDEIDRKAVYRY